MNIWPSGLTSIEFQVPIHDAQTLDKVFGWETHNKCILYVCLPSFLYGLESWGHACEGALIQILVCQKKALRVVFKKPPNSTITYKFKISQIMPIKLLFKYRLIIFMYNMFRNNENLLSELAIEHDFKKKTKSLKLPKINTGKGRRSVFYYGVILVSSHALDLIKNSLQKL